MFWVLLFYAQNKQVLYGLEEVPQSMMLNPGSIVNYDYHFGIPFLSALWSRSLRFIAGVYPIL